WRDASGCSRAQTSAAQVGRRCPIRACSTHGAMACELDCQRTFWMDRAFGNQAAASGREMPAGETPLGVSVVICTYNGAARLPRTLAHLAAQENTGAIAWEVLVVDNASTDDTAEVARRCWPAHAPAPLRIVR